MKKRILALSLAVLTLLCSCSTGEMPEVTTDENDLSSIYHIVEPDIEVPEVHLTAYKINTVTGSYTPLCSDPVCKHNTDECIAYRVSNITRHGDNLYFKKVTGDGDDETRYLYKMNLKTGESEVLLSAKKDEQHPVLKSTDLLPTDTDIFFSLEVPNIPLEEAKEKLRNNLISIEDITSYYELYRFDLETKKEILLGHGEDLSGYSGMNVYPSSENSETTIRWVSGTDTYITDYDLNVIETIPSREEGGARTRYCGEYKYCLEKSSQLNSEVYYDMYVEDKETGEKKLIAENIAVGLVLLEEENTIVYKKYHFDAEVIFDKDATEIQQRTRKKELDYTAGNIYAMNLDGTNNRLLCHIDDPYLEHTSVQLFANYAGLKSCVNNTVLVELKHGYIGLTRDPDDFDEDGFPISAEAHYITAPQTEYLCGYAIVDIKTGEYKVVYPYGDPTTYAFNDRKEDLKKEMAEKNSEKQ